MLGPGRNTDVRPRTYREVLNRCALIGKPDPASSGRKTSFRMLLI